MSKRFVIIRHAEAAADLIKDFDRPLTPFGEAQAHEIGLALRSLGLLPDKIVASAAMRTKTTAYIIAKAFPSEIPVMLKQSLYQASDEYLEQEIAATEAAINTVLLIAHNPGVSYLVQRLSRISGHLHMPPCAFAAFELQSNHWADVYTQKIKLIKYDFPKTGRL